MNLSLHKLILASESPFRASLLRGAGYKFAAMAANIDEKAIRDDNPELLVTKLGIAKNEKVSANFARGEKVIVVSSDQVLARLNKRKRWEILEKPLSKTGRPSKALVRKYLKSYANSPFTAFTSLIVHDMFANRRYSTCDKVEVILTPFTDEEIEIIVADPMTYYAAGALANGISGSKASALIESHIQRIYGDYSGLIGLPMQQLRHTLSVIGYSSANRAKA